MRFELTVALKYLIPRWRQLSVSIISLISILVISLVVWLVILFLSVTEGIEKKWTDQLLTLNAPLKMTPTEAYYRSYYYQIDRLSSASNYTTKTIGEKLLVQASDPYDESFDSELPLDFPSPDKVAEGSLKDLVKEGWEAIGSLKSYGASPQEFEISFGNLRLNLANHESETVINQVSYVASIDPSNTRLRKMLVPSSSEDYTHLLHVLLKNHHSPKTFFDHIHVSKLATTDAGFILPLSLYPKTGSVKAVLVGETQKAIIPGTIQGLDDLETRVQALGYATSVVEIDFAKKVPYALILDDHISFDTHLSEAVSLSVFVEGSVQNLPISGKAPLDQLKIEKLVQKKGSSQPFWIYDDEQGLKIPTGHSLGDGILVAKHFKNSGVKLGDSGFLSYYSPTTSSVQEQRIPIYVAGFYDPGMLPIGNKLIFVDPQVVSFFRGNLTMSDSMIGNGLGNGINIWISDLKKANEAKATLVAALEERGIQKYWKVESFKEYEFTRPILEQLESDKNLFTLIAIIILLVACSNIISMLILLVNDKKKEIGILQSMGASPKRIALIFGMCGFITGLMSSIIGTAAAILTLHHLQSLIDLLSFMQGHEAFQAAFYGNEMPNELSYNALTFVVVATLAISLLAGLIPAWKASRVRPTEILRAE